MYLKNLLLLASAAIGAIAQYDDGFYNEVQYDNFEDDFATSPKVGSLGLANNGIRGLTSRRQSSIASDIVRDHHWWPSTTIAAEIFHHTCKPSETFAKKNMPFNTGL
ncbi:hypothetical protein MBR_10067, partial [Metarhizium brunneum ARSEF 3297]